MFLRNYVAELVILALGVRNVAAQDVQAGFDAFEAAQVMIEKSGQSWEWGTAAEALLELYNPELSVFSSNAFPGGRIPKADPSTFALKYARQYINRNSQVFVDDSAVGDPASLGVSALLLGQSDSVYLDASDRQADYLLNTAPRWTNGAISHRPNVAELWADNMAMSFPFLAYLSVQRNDPGLMETTVNQCGLYRDVLKGGDLNWRHIIGPESQDTGLWSTSNGWAAYGMTRVLHTLQKWPGSSGMSSQAASLKNWIKEILDGAMISGRDNGLLHNYLNDDSWFGEISGTALLSSVAYRMATNDPAMFPEQYIDWADENRKALASKEGGDGVFRPAVNPYAWGDRNPFNNGSPEGQAFTIYLYTAYRDCVQARVCSAPASATTISKPGIGPIDIMTFFEPPLTFSSMPDPTGTSCAAPQSCDAGGCDGYFDGLAKYPICRGGNKQGCRCIATQNTCGAHQSCDAGGCAGAFNGLVKYAQCTGNFEGCECTATQNTCGPHQSCDAGGCAGAFNGLAKYAQCTGNFEGCECTATSSTCGPHQSCDAGGCAGAFNGLAKYAQCTGNFEGCECTATANACGSHQSCDAGGCAGAFNGLAKYAQCTGNFEGCECTATSNTCGPHQSCDAGGCAGAFNGLAKYAQCTGNFEGCECTATTNTCGSHQSCDAGGCAGAFNGLAKYAQCTGNFEGCECTATANTCGPHQSCDAGGCAGAFNGPVKYAQCTGNFEGCECTASRNTCGDPQSCGMNNCGGDFDLGNGIAYCRNNFEGCECQADAATCGSPLSCDMNHCDGAFTTNSPLPVCTNFFKGCKCQATGNTCGNKQSCDQSGCAGGYDSNGVARCQGNFLNCECNATPNTCGAAQRCDLGGCNGGFDSNSNVARCRGNFPGCVCIPVESTCGQPQSCSSNGCAGIFDGGRWYCSGAYYGCGCNPDSSPPPPPPPQGPNWIFRYFTDRDCRQNQIQTGGFGPNSCQTLPAGAFNSFCIPRGTFPDNMRILIYKAQGCAGNPIADLRVTEQDCPGEVAGSAGCYEYDTWGSWNAVYL